MSSADTRLVPIFTSLRSHAKLDRDSGLSQLENILLSLDPASKQHIVAGIIELLCDETHWESRHGGLMACTAILRLSEEEFKSYEVDFVEGTHRKALDLLKDKENRVRVLAGEVIGHLCRQVGKEVYERSSDVIVSLIRENMERSVDRQEHASQDASLQIVHETVGWKGLEAGMTCLCCVIQNIRGSFDEFIDLEFLDLVFGCLVHTSRFVRETGFQLVGLLVKVEEGSEGHRAALRYDDQFCEALAGGLADNWSQVRLAASVATREFLLGLPEDDRKKHFSRLLPRICLNRYYVAEGVRLYSQETWKLVTQDQGRLMIENYIADTVDFYISQTMADNHAVREAACTCIAELGTKIGHSAMQPHVQRLLPSLLTCFRDDSWPVRDAACIACGNFAKCFPQECQLSLHDLYALFFENLADGISSVRQGAALALSFVVEAYGEGSLDIVMKVLQTRIIKVKDQPATSMSSMDTSPAIFGVVKRARDNDPSLHTDKLMYSCGSLAPKMKRGAGCMHSDFRRAAEPWEEADGCVVLLAELARLSFAADEVLSVLPSLAESCNCKSYPQHFSFLETVWKQLPRIAKGVGKRKFKRHLELFFPSLFYSLDCSVPLTSVAASDLLVTLKGFIGESIFRGRVEQYDPRMLEKLDGP
eukprot:m.7493 g.7493  ORF g.7493 m.7493 type:complete len:648 (+) comp18796_c0_seq1:28-1971(+)